MVLIVSSDMSMPGTDERGEDVFLVSFAVLVTGVSPGVRIGGVMSPLYTLWCSTQYARDGTDNGWLVAKIRK